MSNFVAAIFGEGDTPEEAIANLNREAVPYIKGLKPSDTVCEGSVQNQTRVYALGFYSVDVNYSQTNWNTLHLAAIERFTVEKNTNGGSEAPLH